MAQIIPAAAGYFTRNWKDASRIPIIGWKSESRVMNQCSPLTPGNADWPDTEYHAIENSDGTVYDVDSGLCFEDVNQWNAAKYDACTSENPEARLAYFP